MRAQRPWPRHLIGDAGAEALALAKALEKNRTVTKSSMLAKSLNETVLEMRAQRPWPRHLRRTDGD